MIQRVTQEDTWCGTGLQFVNGRRRKQKGIKTTEHPKVSVTGIMMIHNASEGMILEIFMGNDVQKVGGHLKSMVPKVGRDRGVSKHGANHVVDGPNSTFRLTIMRGCVRTREAKNQTVVGAVRFETLIIILAAISALQTLNG